MKKILFWGDSPTSGTGFGNVINFIIKHLPKDQFKVYVLGTSYNKKSNDLDYEIVSIRLGAETTDRKKVKNIINRINPDILFCLNDIWILDGIASFLIDSGLLNKGLKVVGYVPVDASDHDPDWYKNTHVFDKLVVYNEYGKSVVKKAVPNQEVDIIEHGVDSKVFYKEFETRIEAKRTLFKVPKLHDSFIILNAGRNQPRKRLDITLRAFAEFSKDKQDVFLYMHSGAKDSHIDTIRLAKELDILPKLIMTTDQKGVPNLHLSDLNLLYNACDVGINTGLGEGFGLPNAEHAATGAVQIVPAHSALIDLYQDCGILIPANTLFTLDNISTTAKMVMVQDVTDALELVYRDREQLEKHSKLCYEKFTSEKYSWKHITQQWIELFNAL